MSRVWDRTIGEMREMPERMTQFLEDIKTVCKKHNLSISHEDYHGAFFIEEYNEDNIKWLFNASKNYRDVEIIWDDDEITWDDIPYDVKEMVEYGIYTKEEVLKEYNNGRKRHRKYINISENNT